MDQILTSFMSTIWSFCSGAIARFSARILFSRCLVSSVTDMAKVQEWFGMREDKLQSRIHEDGVVTEEFSEGRQRSLQQHIYKANDPGPEAERSMSFYHKARFDHQLFFVLFLF